MEKLIKAIGIIIPISWDKLGNPLDYALYTFDEKIYRLQFETEGKIEPLLQKMIQINGILKKKQLKVKEVTILGNGVH